MTQQFSEKLANLDAKIESVARHLKALKSERRQFIQGPKARERAAKYYASHKKEILEKAQAKRDLEKLKTTVEQCKAELGVD